ncbi:glycosyltransferase [Mesorhizobium sp. YR577]|uniref:glycosyltransferase n=1 Tax=Mesorhizobium sp. YR577 TaxID=1884373 RepID=UPI0008E86D27|nr:glycosyltransferase [Mesorhizobium sp. YR577]SFU20925.1 Glycosyl transferase family 2 [Mesorhizobium sp. YR577]
MEASILSIVMPCLNGMPHIRDAIESVKSAIPAGNVEIVVADGGSTDGTLEFLRNAPVTLIEGPDRSLYEGLNKAIASARGEYLVWLNSDDLLLGGMTELWRKAQESLADIGTGEAEIAVDGKPNWKSDHHAREMSIASLLFAVPTINSRIISTGLLREAGPFRCDIGLGADRDMMLKLFGLSRKRIFLNSAVYRYNSHSGSRTMGATWKSYQDVHDANLQMVRVLRKEMTGNGDRELIAAFELVSTIARARAEFFNGAPAASLGSVLRAFRNHPSPRTWLRGKSFYLDNRGRGSGW